MFKPEFINNELSFRSLSERNETDMIVIHHTGNAKDDDLSATDIHEIHLANGWAGIGYHYVIRKNGAIELGRPVNCIGAHAEGENSHSIGIHFSGNFEDAEPTKKQIESGAILIAWLCEKYGIDCTRSNIVGHRELMATACPGENLYSKLDEMVGKAVWYGQHYDAEEGYRG